MEVRIEIDQLRKRGLFLAVPMYGGQCLGMFAKSYGDLVTMCSQYGIPLKTYFLFNESLIPRARNYCADEFMRSEMKHLMFIDADIGFNANDVIAMMALQVQNPNTYDIIGGPYPKKSCHYRTKIVTEDGIKSLGKIVKEKYSGGVLSYNEDRGFEFKKVINWFKTPANSKPWVKLSSSADSDGTITCTYDHEVASIIDPLDCNINWTEAQYMQRKHIIIKDQVNGNKAFSGEQIEFLLGTLLGDSSISNKTYQIRNSHCEKQKDYALLKADLFGLSTREENVSLREKKFPVITSWGGTNYQTRYLRELMYVDGKKTLKNIIDRITLKSLAFLYMDDGIFLKHDDSQSAGFCVEGFSDGDLELLSNRIRQLGYECSIIKKGDGTDHKRIRIFKADSLRFFEDISPYIPECMEYKLPSQFRSNSKFNYQKVARLNFTISRPINVTTLTESYDQYDITVEDNYNFVANNYLVHNCISWEKIKAAVDKGVADDDPNVLEKYVGDYVFNPKGTQQEIPLSAPVEVLEIGTGFMMITREALEKFQQTYPQYMYRPDHVRTEAFDGSREIMMYFQAEIDPASKRYLSEDYWFCQKAQQAGLRTWLCPWMHMQHVGTYIFGGSLIDLASIGVHATADVSKIKKAKK